VESSNTFALFSIWIPSLPRSMANEMRDEFGERATVVVILNAGQALTPEQPAAVVDAIAAWIGGLPR
jgi:hypothetical protein